MLLRIQASGPGSDQISYRIGNHPSRQLIRRESEALGRLWFSEYSEERCSVILHVRSNVPSIPNRLMRPDLRLREWHRLAEWIDSFLGKVVRDPQPSAPEEQLPEFKIRIGTLPNPLKLEEELVDLFDRADLDVKESPGDVDCLDHWLHLSTRDLTFSQILRRLGILIPSILGGGGPGRAPKNFARLLDELRGTWFNVHPCREYIANRFLWLTESHNRTERNGNPVSVVEDRQEFKRRRNLFDRVGKELKEGLTQKGIADNDTVWMINVGDGSMFPELAELTDEMEFYFVEGHRGNLPRLKQRIRWLAFSGEVTGDIDTSRIHWNPPGHRLKKLKDKPVMVWTPMACEVSDGMIREMANVYLSSYQPEQLLVWAFVRNDSIHPANNMDDQLEELPDVSEWRKVWETFSEQESYRSSWTEHIFVDENPSGFDKLLLGNFKKKEDYV